MRRIALLLSGLLLVMACGRKERTQAADSPAAAAVPSMSLAEFAGRWSIQLLSEMSDSVLASYELNATADGASWTITPEGGGEPITMRAEVEDDSLQLDAGPYKTPKPADVNVTMHGVGRLEGGVLVGSFITQYALATKDSIVRGRLRGTRVP